MRRELAADEREERRCVRDKGCWFRRRLRHYSVVERAALVLVVDVVVGVVGEGEDGVARG